MATNYMLGNTTVYTIYPESVFSTIPLTASVAPLVIGQKIDMKLNYSTVDRPLHTGQLTDVRCNTVQTSAQGTVTFDGAFSLDYIQLFQSYLQNSGSLGSGQTFSTDQVTYTIVQYDTKYPTMCRYATGCKVKSISLNGTSKDYMKMSAQFVARTVSDWTTRPTMTGSYAHYTTLPCHKPVKFADLTLAFTGEYYSINSITINFDSQLVQDSVRYGNASAPTNHIMTKKMMTVDIQTLFDPTGTGVTSNANKFGVIGTGQTGYDLKLDLDGSQAVFDLQVLPIDYTLADPDAGVWKNTYNLKGVYNTDDSEPMVKITTF